MTAYFVGEGEAGTESNPTYDQVNLVAKKVMALTTVTNELSEDSVLNMGDELAYEVALAFATKEDQCGFLGDLTSTYGNMYGVKPKLTTVGTAGLKTANSGTHTDWTQVTLAELNGVVALLPEYAETPNVAWYCSKAFFSGVMEVLLYAAGGNTLQNLQGGTQRQFLGYPVELTATMPKTAASAEVVCMLGDLRLAADFGDRRQMSIAFSSDAVVGSVSVFETDETAMRATQRFDINVHDVGSASVAGPVVGLLTAS
jgi:HK97 family phage major capsid protein